MRVCDAMQTADKYKVVTPVNWKKGEDCIIPPTISDEEAKKMFPGYTTIKPYLRTTPLKL